MRPADLQEATFAAYPPRAREFAQQHLGLLRRLPLAVCPSFLQQIQALDTSFPAERDSLAWQCEALQSMQAAQFDNLMAPLRSLRLNTDLEQMDWVGHPAAFVEQLTAYLWSSGDMPRFRSAARDLFAEIPSKEDASHRLVIVALGQGATADERTVLRKLRKRGVFLTGLDAATMPQQIAEALRSHMGPEPSAYRSWYVDGAGDHATFRDGLKGTERVSYQGLAPLRNRVLERMQATIASGTAGAEQMRSRLADTTPAELRAGELTPDPVLGRFYTELFTLSSGAQVFSTSFVQWTGRELARRVRPQTTLLRYTPRQQHHDMNELFANPDAGALDPQSSLRDAEMGAYLNWLEFSRISAPGKLTFVAYVEGHPYGVVIGADSRPSTAYAKPVSLYDALKAFG